MSPFSFKKFLKENLDNKVDSHVRNFRDNIRQHGTYGKNALTAMVGKDLMDAGYQDFLVKNRQAGLPEDNSIAMNVWNNLNKVKSLEKSHKEQLERLAIDLVADYMNLDKSLFHAELADNLQHSRYVAIQGKTEKPDYEMAEITPQLQKHIDRRNNLYLLSTGHALDIMDKLHFEKKEDLEKIDANLPELYKKLSLGTRGTYYFTRNVEAYKSPQNRRQGAVGEADLKWNEDNQRWEIYGTAITFPFLVQELVKGAMNYVASHSYWNLSDAEKNTVIHHTGKSEDEPYQFLMGPQMWQYMLKALPKDLKTKENLNDIHFILSTIEPEETNNLLRRMVEEMHSGGKAPEFENSMRDELEKLHELRRKEEMGEQEEGPEQEDDDYDSWWRGEDEGDDDDGGVAPRR